MFVGVSVIETEPGEEGPTEVNASIQLKIFVWQCVNLVEDFRSSVAVAKQGSKSNIKNRAAELAPLTHDEYPSEVGTLILYFG